MPRWPNKFFVPSPSQVTQTPPRNRDHGNDDTKSSSLGSLLRSVRHEEGVALHNVPVLDSETSQDLNPVHRPSGHGRSLSHPFISVSGSASEMKREFYNSNKRQGEHTAARHARDIPPAAHVSGPAWPVANDRRRSNGGLEGIVGRCTTCGTKLRWPPNILVFRCTVCLMINDIQPVKDQFSKAMHGGAITSDIAVDPKDGGGNGTYMCSLGTGPNADTCAVKVLSLARTKLIIENCIFDYAQYISEEVNCYSRPDTPRHESFGLLDESKISFEKGSSEVMPDLAGESQDNAISSAALGDTSFQRRDDPTSAAEVPMILRHDAASELAITCSPFTKIAMSAQERTPTPNLQMRSHTGPQSETYTMRSIFLPLENYIISCFEDIESLNASFLTQRPSSPRRRSSKNVIRSIRPSQHSPGSVQPHSEKLLPVLDAKTLLISDIAENGLWWAGVEEEADRRPGSSSKVHSRSRNSKSTPKYPNIDWQELYDWYEYLLSMPDKLNEIVNYKISKSSNASDRLRWTEMLACLSVKQGELALSCCHLRRTLLKATERLLRRPRRPICSPEQCRFFLILLANPLLFSHESEKRGVTQNTDHADPSFSRGEAMSLSSKSPRSQLITPKASVAHRHRYLSHTGIIKRLLGLLSNLHAECQQCLTQWFTRTPERFFGQFVELVSLFLNYRLAQHSAIQEIDKNGNTDTLVPELSQNAMGSSAQLHAALGIGGAPKPPQNGDRVSWYANDWQLVAAAKVISILYAANVDHSTRRISSMPDKFTKSMPPEIHLSNQERSYKHGQLLPTSYFYISMLDSIDLVADYETWESRKGGFSFCQYPMTISMSAKIRLMEYDARRQMELKAREAFFDSIKTHKALNQYLIFRVRRECLVEDSLRNVSEAIGSGQDEIKKGLRIEFEGEDGYDAGGLRKEWFLQLIREVFDPGHGLFVYDDESPYCYFSPHTFETTDQFFLIGAVLGLAIYNSTILDVALPPFAFRKLLASAPVYSISAATGLKGSYTHTIDDLAELRPSLARGLRQLLNFEGDVQQTFCRDFVIEVGHYGQIVQVPLCDNGEAIPVTNENRQKFVDLYVRYTLDVAVTRQYEPFKRGFYSVCGGNAITLFRPEEIDLLVRGSAEGLDVSTLRAVAVYEGWGEGAPSTSIPAIRWFWSVFENADPEDQRRLLSFITSSDRIPAVGATGLVIKISCLGENCERFPIARTCFNMLGLYRYNSKARLEEKLWRAVNESEGFALR